MSVQRIDNDAKRMHGWQARVYTVASKYVSAFFADRAHGGKRKARALAEAEHARLARRAKRIRWEASRA